MDATTFRGGGAESPEVAEVARVPAGLGADRSECFAEPFTGGIFVWAARPGAEVEEVAFGASAAGVLGADLAQGPLGEDRAGVGR